MHTTIKLFLLGLALSPAALANPDYFPLKVGDSWNYRITSAGKTSNFTIKVVKQTGDQFQVETTSTQVIDDWYSKSAGWVQIHKTAYPKSKMTADMKPPRKLLKNPLMAGEKWDWKGTGMMGVSMEEHNKVVGAALVKVPAGEFGAMRLDTACTQGGAKVSKVYYYAPNVGMVKSETESSGVKSTCELMDWSFKGRK